MKHQTLAIFFRIFFFFEGALKQNKFQFDYLQVYQKKLFFMLEN